MRRAVAVGGVLILGAVSCSTQDPAPAPVERQPAPTIRVVGAYTPTAVITPGAEPTLAVRPVGDRQATEAARRAGKAVGPVVTHAGIVRADGRRVDPVGKTAQGVPIYQHPVGSGFMIVVEGKEGVSNVEVGRSIFRYNEDDPSLRPDIEIQVDRPLGDGSPAVCDARRPNIGGIPAIDPPNFAENDARISATLNDLSCRFETFIESNASCTLNTYGDFEFLNKDTKVQFCLVVARSWRFPQGDTLVSVRLRDTDGNPGPVSRFVLRNKPNPTPPRRATPMPTPTAPRRRP